MKIIARNFSAKRMFLFALFISLVVAVAAPNLITSIGVSTTENASSFFADSLGQKEVSLRTVHKNYSLVLARANQDLVFHSVKFNKTSLPLGSKVLLDSGKGELISSLSGEVIGNLIGENLQIIKKYDDSYFIDVSQQSGNAIIAVQSGASGLTEIQSAFNVDLSGTSIDKSSLAYLGTVYEVDSEAGISAVLTSKPYSISVMLNGYIDNLVEWGNDGLTNITGYIDSVLSEGGLSGDLRDSLLQLKASFSALSQGIQDGSIGSLTENDVSSLKSSASGIAVSSSAVELSLATSNTSSLTSSGSSGARSLSLAATTGTAIPTATSGTGSGSSQSGTGSTSTNTTSNPTTPGASTSENVVVPSKANVGTAINNLTCDSSDGFYTHPLQDKNCILANTFKVSLGNVLSLSYSSRRSDSGFYGIPGFRTSFYSYVTKDLTYFVGTSSEKVKLVRSGSTLKRENFLWGDDYIFTIVSAGEISRKVGSRTYTYNKQVDNNFHLSKIADEESSLIEITYQSSFLKNSRNELLRTPEVKSIKYRNDAGAYETVEVKAQVAFLERYLSPSVGSFAIPPQVVVDYPGEAEDYSIFFKKVSKEEIVEKVEARKVNDIVLGYDFTYFTAASSRNYPVAKVVRVRDQEAPVAEFYGYDSVGHMTYYQRGQEADYFYDVTFPPTKSYSSVTIADKYKQNTTYGFKSMCGSALKVAKSSLWGNFAYRYSGNICYARKTWDPRIGWGPETTLYTETAKTVKELDGSSTTFNKSGATSVYTSKYGKVTYTELSGGGYRSVSEFGKEKTEENLTVSGDSRIYESTQYQGNKIVENTRVVSSGGVSTAEDLLTGAKTRTASSGDSFERTYSSPRSPTYKQVVTSSDQSRSQVFYKDDQVLSSETSNSDGTGERVQKQSGTNWSVRESWGRTEDESTYNRSYVR